MLTESQLNQLRRAPLHGKRNKLGIAMAIAGTTQVELAEALGVTQPHVSAVSLGRYGRSGLPLETTRKFAQFFGCSIEDLFPCEQPEVVQ